MKSILVSCHVSKFVWSVIGEELNEVLVDMRTFSTLARNNQERVNWVMNKLVNTIITAIVRSPVT